MNKYGLFGIVILFFILNSCLSSMIIRDIKYPQTRIKEIDGISVKVGNIERDITISEEDRKKYKFDATPDNLVFFNKIDVGFFTEERVIIKLEQGKLLTKEIAYNIKNELNSLGYDTSSDKSDYQLSIKLIKTSVNKKINDMSEPLKFEFLFSFEYSLLKDENILLDKVKVEKSRIEPYWVFDSKDKLFLENNRRMVMNTLQPCIDQIISGCHEKIVEDLLNGQSLTN